MASMSSLQRTRRVFLVVSLLGFGLALAFGAYEATRPAAHRVARAEPPKSARPAPAPAPAQTAEPGVREARRHLRTPDEAPLAPAPAEAPTPVEAPAPVEATEAAAPQATGLAADLPLLSACASLSAALIALLGFVITSVMTLRKERRDSALFAVEIEMKRVQLEALRTGQHGG
jgi:hypothetical protein